MNRKIHRVVIEEGPDLETPNDPTVWVRATCVVTGECEFACADHRSVDETIEKALAYLNGEHGWPFDCPDAEHVL